jgi:hypothetical protein
MAATNAQINLCLGTRAVLRSAIRVLCPSTSTSFKYAHLELPVAGCDVAAADLRFGRVLGSTEQQATSQTPLVNS